MDAAEFAADSLPRHHAGLLVVFLRGHVRFTAAQVSQSGETKDVHRAVEVLRLPWCKTSVFLCVQVAIDEDVPRFSVLPPRPPPFIHSFVRVQVVNSVGSLIARTTKCGVYLHAGRENAVASTKAFVTQVRLSVSQPPCHARSGHCVGSDQRMVL